MTVPERRCWRLRPSGADLMRGAVSGRAGGRNAATD